MNFLKQRRTGMTHRRSIGIWLVLWCVLAALSLSGVTSVVVTLLGSHHTHTSDDVDEAAGMVLEDFRRLDRGYEALSLARARAHTVLQRHHHDRHDATVHSLDAAAEESVGDGAAASAIGVLAMMLCGFALLMVTAPLARSVRWTRRECPAIPMGHAHLLERPPRF